MFFKFIGVPYRRGPGIQNAVRGWECSCFPSNCLMCAYMGGSIIQAPPGPMFQIWIHDMGHEPMLDPGISKYYKKYLALTNYTFAVMHPDAITKEIFICTLPYHKYDNISSSLGKYIQCKQHSIIGIVVVQWSTLHIR